MDIWGNSSVVERSLRMRDVRGSIPCSSKKVDPLHEGFSRSRPFTAMQCLPSSEPVALHSNAVLCHSMHAIILVPSNETHCLHAMCQLAMCLLVLVSYNRGRKPGRVAGVRKYRRRA